MWKCTEYCSKSCPGRAHVVSEEIELRSNHNHAPNAEKIMAKKTVNGAKERATSTTEPPQRILADAIANVPEATFGSLPNRNLLKKTIRRARRRLNMPPPMPNSLEELVIPASFRQLADGQEFLLFDSSAERDLPENQRFLIFSTKRNLQLMMQSTQWQVDGTFHAAPHLFSQLYTIHAIHYGSTIPSIFVLLPNKSQETYTRMIQAIKHLQPGLAPATILSDFERSAINAFKGEFPNAVFTGCFFHFQQCIWRRVQQIEGMVSRYSEDVEFALQVRHLASLAFVPVPDVVRAFEALTDSDYYEQNAILAPLVYYFENNWIGRLQTRNRRRVPPFEIAIWNQHQNVVNGLARSNNSVEGWHHAFNQILGASHPTIWKLVEDLKKQQVLNSFNIEQLIRGENIQKKKKYRDLTIRLENLVQSYSFQNILTYLRGVAHNFQL